MLYLLSAGAFGNVFYHRVSKESKIRLTQTGITVNVILRYGNLEQLCPAKIDTGSDACLFSRTVADFLEIDVESGYRENFGTLTSNLVAYQHEIELKTLGLRFQTKVLFCGRLCRSPKFARSARIFATGEVWFE